MLLAHPGYFVNILRGSVVSKTFSEEVAYRPVLHKFFFFDFFRISPTRARSSEVTLAILEHIAS